MAPSNEALLNNISKKSPSPSSVHTASTAASSTNYEMQTTKSLDKRRRPRRKGDQPATKDMLLGLIAKEMTSTFQHESQGGFLAEEEPEGVSAADIFYAQMNGEAYDSGLTASIRSETTIPEEEDLDEAEIFDDACSFANLGLAIEDLVEEDNKSRRSRNSRNSHGSRSSRSSSQSETTESKSDALSIDEIQQSILLSMPPEIRDKIDKDAWTRIFQSATSTNQKKKKNKSKQEPQKPIEEFALAGMPDDDDDDSVISGITECGASVRGPVDDEIGDDIDLTPLTKEEEQGKWDEELCPGLQSDAPTLTSTTDSRVSAASSARLSVRESASGSVVASKDGGVRFGYVQVRYYEQILDINPAVTTGIAIGIGWRYKSGGEVRVEDWELRRGQLRKSNELVIPRHDREKLLKDLGYTQKDIADANRIIRKAKERRKVTVENLNLANYEEALEAASQRVKNILTFGRKKGLVKK